MKTAILSFVRAKQGRFFSVKFTTVDGHIRIINGRTGVRYNGEPLASINEHGNLMLWDRATQSIKTIRPDSIKALRFDGMIAEVK